MTRWISEAAPLAMPAAHDWRSASRDSATTEEVMKGTRCAPCGRDNRPESGHPAATWTPCTRSWRRGPSPRGDASSLSAATGAAVRDIVDELTWLGCGLDRPRRLLEELVRVGGWLVVEWARPRHGCRSPMDEPPAAFGPSVTPRAWAAGAFAAIDAPQWPWLIDAANEGGRWPPVAWERWCHCADRFAAWAFGVGLPAVRDRAALFRGRFAIVAGDRRWIAPSVRRMSGSLVVLARERARCAEGIA